MNRRAIGDEAEMRAADYLTGRGFQLLERHFCIRGGEIDLILLDGPYVVFVEVKYRASTAYGLAREAVTLQKQQRIVKTAASWLHREKRIEDYIRFDVVEVTPQGITHLPNAFDASVLEV